jgi:DNA repair ATPase RecN
VQRRSHEPEFGEGSNPSPATKIAPLEGQVMIEKVVVRNYQSIKKLDIEIGSLTVIVGESNSGKSAMHRAMKMLASNARGTSYVTVGEKVAAVGVKTDTGAITLERGANNHGVYRLLIDGKETTFTKLGGSVPELITRNLKIAPVKDGMSVNFAGQHDRPYLLDSSGQEVAKVLGDLTNVSTIFEAVREANRRRQGANSVLKTRLSDLDVLRQEAKDFQDLDEQIAACDEAEEALEGAQAINSKVSRLKDLLTDLTVAELALEDSRVKYVVPDTSHLEGAYSKYNTFTMMMTALSSHSREMINAKGEAELFASEQEQLHQQLHDALVEHGVCPTCGTEMS